MDNVSITSYKTWFFTVLSLIEIIILQALTYSYLNDRAGFVFAARRLNDPMISRLNRRIKTEHKNNVPKPNETR